jgi:hypothetical protein
MPLVVIILVLLAIVLLAGWWFDHSRRREGRTAYEDRRPYRPDYHGESTEFGHAPPTPYIDHPDGGGPPPGVERPDEHVPRR